MTSPSQRAAVIVALNCLVLAVVSVMGLVAAEAYARLMADSGMRYEFEMMRYAERLKMLTSDPELPFTHRPNAVARIMGVDIAINDIGLRDNRHFSAFPPKGTTRVLMLGDSVTFGFGVSLNATTSAVLETRLQHKFGTNRIEIINAGVGNYNTSMEVQAYAMAAAGLHPHVVVLNYFLNDAEPTPSPTPTLLSRYSFGWTLLITAFDTTRRTLGSAPDWRSYYQSMYQPTSPGWLRTRRSFEHLVALCRSDGASLLLVNYPDLHQVSPYPFNNITGLIEAMAASKSVPFLDMLPAVDSSADPRRLWVHDDDPHPNSEAHGRFAERLGNWLIAEHAEVLTAR